MFHAMLAVCTVAVIGAVAATANDGPWPAPVEGWVAPQPGEHPRLLFRKADLAKIKARAQTEDGKAILARLRFLLDAKNGDTLPSDFNRNKPVNTGAKGPGQLPIGAFTMGHPAGYAFLHVLTGEKKYADLAKQALIKFIEGTPDRDERYTWTSPGAGLRTGMMMTCVAMAYDLAYDAWDDAFRRRVVDEIQNYKHVCVVSGGWEGGAGGLTFDRIVNPYYPPGSNHYGALVGGGATAALAIKGDPGADDKRLDRLLADAQRNLVRAMSEGFGDHGFFAEGPGPSHMAANTSLVTAIQTMKIAGGKDFITPRTNGAWLTLRWAFETIAGRDGKPYYPCRSPSSYGTEHFARGGTSDGGEFCQGFGAIRDSARGALLYTYRNFVEPAEAKEYADRLPAGQKSYDALTYPHRAVLALVNWPIDVRPEDPGEVLGRSYRDSIHGYLAFRNAWKGADDIIVTAYLKSGPGGFIKNNDVSLMVWGLGMRLKLAGLTGKCIAYEPKPDGSGVFSVEGNGGITSVGIDFSGASGVPCLVVACGGGYSTKAEQRQEQGASARVTPVAAGKNSFTVITLSRGAAPEPKAQGDQVVVGGRTMMFDGRLIGYNP